MIRSGECDAAIVGSANLCFHPNLTFQQFQFGILSPDGYCKPFDESGSGYMRSEATVVIYLQKAKNAKRIYATLVYSKTNCDEDFYDECGITPEELSYIEAHGTGTLAGDLVEINAIDQALCSKRSTPLLVGSVKSRFGHTEAAAGLCQVAKVPKIALLVSCKV
ncbi:fatty acid synthase-like [Harpegnathos saltator]|uniref:fatty acid synthase-like n=1 Tax=Harpegnathos saltator TaxID=610380 RepID=UPI000DBEE244|nr:fatty acid synthase-like [Harpegnathos saltator]